MLSSSSIHSISSINLPPAQSGAPKKTLEALKENTSPVPSQGFQHSRVVISNNELFAIMKRLEHQVTQHKEDNRKVLKEIEKRRTEIHKPQEAAPSILQPRIMNIENTGSTETTRR